MLDGIHSKLLLETASTYVDGQRTSPGNMGRRATCVAGQHVSPGNMVAWAIGLWYALVQYLFYQQVSNSTSLSNTEYQISNIRYQISNTKNQTPSCKSPNPKLQNEERL